MEPLQGIKSKTGSTEKIGAQRHTSRKKVACSDIFGT